MSLSKTLTRNLNSPVLVIASINRGKTLLHEFSKLRWGVFEEHGYPGDDMFPMFYLKETWGANGQETVVKPNFCVNGDLKGYEQVKNIIR